MGQLTALQVSRHTKGTITEPGGLRLVDTRWKYRYTFAGKRREIGLGSKEDVTLKQARELRQKWAGVLAQGKDPIAEREKEIAAIRAEMDAANPTFEAMALDTFDAIKATLRGDGKRGRWYSPIQLHVIPAIGQMRISEIHQKHIRDALAPLWKSKQPTAKKAIERTRKIFEFARHSGYNCTPETVDSAQHMLGHVTHVVKHHAALPWQDMPDLWASLNGDYPSTWCLKWLILTAVRSDAARGARWDEIEGDVWTVPADRVKGTKDVKDFRVPISGSALDLLSTIRPLSKKFIFPSPHGKAISDQAVWKIMRKKCPGATIHGFRSSFKDWCRESGNIDWEVSEIALGHSVADKMQRSYARSDLLERRRMAMQRWGDFVVNEGAKVVRLRT